MIICLRLFLKIISPSLNCHEIKNGKKCGWLWLWPCWPLDSLCFALLALSFCYCSMILVISLSCVVKLTVEHGIFVIFHEVFHELKGHFFHDFVTFCAKLLC